LFESGGYQRDRPQILVPGDLNDIEPAHHKKRTRQNKHQWNQDLAGIEESHRCTSNPIVKGCGVDLSLFSANGDPLPVNAVARTHIYAFMLN
jgi:hypothetical protein